MATVETAAPSKPEAQSGPGLLEVEAPGGSTPTNTKKRRCRTRPRSQRRRKSGPLSCQPVPLGRHVKRPEPPPILPKPQERLEERPGPSKAPAAVAEWPQERLELKQDPGQSFLPWRLIPLELPDTRLTRPAGLLLAKRDCRIKRPPALHLLRLRETKAATTQTVAPWSPVDPPDQPTDRPPRTPGSRLDANNNEEPIKPRAHKAILKLKL